MNTKIDSWILRPVVSRQGGSVLLDESIGDKRLKCLRRLIETTIDMLVATRGIIARNQELINRDPISENYYFKGFVPAVVGSQVAKTSALLPGII